MGVTLRPGRRRPARPRRPLSPPPRGSPGERGPPRAGEPRSVPRAGGGCSGLPGGLVPAGAGVWRSAPARGGRAGVSAGEPLSPSRPPGLLGPSPEDALGGREPTLSAMAGA